MSADNTNVVIVGGGIIGSCIAYFLAREGAGVTVLEKGPICAEASSAAVGMTIVSTRDGFLLELASRSLKMLEELQAELETPMELNHWGTMTLLRTEEEFRQQEAYVEKQRARGMPIELLGREAALRMEPLISPDILGAVHSPVDAAISPFSATVAFARGAKRLGATFKTGVEVTSLKLEGDRVTAAVTRDGEVAGDVIVLAAGAWSPQLARTIGIDIPIEPSRGQILVTEAQGPLSRTIVKDTGHIYICPTARGNYAIGSMTEKAGFNKQVTPAKLQEYLREGARLLPALKGVRIIRSWAGLRPLSPDNMAILGPVEGYEGIVMAAGHSRLGILLSAVTSKIVSDLIVKGSADLPLEKFSASRFKTVA